MSLYPPDGDIACGFVFIAARIAVVLAALRMLCGLVSLSISRKERGGVLALFDETYQRQMLLPRSIVGYRECVAELKALGIPVIVPPRMCIGKLYQPLTRWQKVQRWLLTFLFFFCTQLAFSRYSDASEHHLFGALLLIGVLVGIAIHAFRKHWENRLEQLLGVLLFLALLLAVCLRW